MDSKAKTTSAAIADVVAHAPSDLVPASEQPFDEDFGIRFGLQSEKLSGHRDLFLIRDGLILLLGDIEHSVEHTESISSDEFVKFHFRYSGASEIGYVGGARNPIEPMSFSVLIQPEGLGKLEHFSSEQHERSVTLLCSIRFLESMTAGTVIRIPLPLKRLLAGEPADYYYFASRMRPEMTACVKSLLDSPLHGPLQRLHVESKALDLFCQVLSALSDMASSDPDERPLRKRDLHRVAEICEVLEKRLSSPPTISELAREFGWNDTQLMRTFRQAVGMTVYNYQLRARMERAHELLIDSDLSITEIAFDVGYEYSTNFTTAFRRYFNLTPKQAREAGAAGQLAGGEV